MVEITRSTLKILWSNIAPPPPSCSLSPELSCNIFTLIAFKLDVVVLLTAAAEPTCALSTVAVSKFKLPLAIPVTSKTSELVSSLTCVPEDVAPVVNL